MLDDDNNSETFSFELILFFELNHVCMYALPIDGLATTKATKTNRNYRALEALFSFRRVFFRWKSQEKLGM